MHRRVRIYGLWAITAARGHEDQRVFLEDRKGDWPVSPFQRAIGVRLYPQSVYRRSFARMAEWKGFFATHARGAPEKRIHSLVRAACKNLGEPKARSKAVTNASKLLQGATGHAVVWAKHLRLLARPPRARLLARLYVKAPPLGDA
jgi:hypothetical protein